jgi:hypothetical protein
MKSSLFCASIALVLATAAIHAPAASASEATIDSGDVVNSLSGTQLKCDVAPSPNFVTYCQSGTPQSPTYQVTFKVFAPVGGPYAYAWTVPSLMGQSISSGCTSTSSVCVLRVNNYGSHLNTIYVTVVDPVTNESVSTDASYETWAVCGSIFC